MLQNFGTALSREQMKNVLGGGDEAVDTMGEGSNKCNVACKSNSDCDTACGSCEKNTNWDNQKFCVR